MAHNRYALFSLLCIFQNSVSVEPANQNKDQNEPIKLTPLYAPEISEAVREAINNDNLKQKTDLTNEVDAFSEEEIEDMELVFEYSPIEARCIFNRLKSPTYFTNNQNYKSALFFGKTGTGKTAMAKAIAYKLAQHGWNYKYLSSISVLDDHPKKMALRLQKELDGIVSSGKPTIIILDDLNILFNNTDRFHGPDATLWTFLDKQKNNKKIFFIGIMPSRSKSPKFFKDSDMFNYIKFNLFY